MGTPHPAPPPAPWPQPHPHPPYGLSPGGAAPAGPSRCPGERGSTPGRAANEAGKQKEMGIEIHNYEEFKIVNLIQPVPTKLLRDSQTPPKGNLCNSPRSSGLDLRRETGGIATGDRDTVQAPRTVSHNDTDTCHLGQQPWQPLLALARPGGNGSGPF
ncbi:hypothetical protein llap_17905 [Limosa lapponica baueri]|uniref:Uncharacterized protein n=1 Tax=Limosa lapponica baueri TaxID=1758121 RepID=A0A2I0TDA1_LIMLA|nr:hypothetical protein llap_17905 [Limosa lapponica baueri]